MKKVKRIIAVLLCLIVMTSCVSMFSYANSNSVRSTSISYADCSLQISGINSSSAAIMQTSSSMSLGIKMELQKLKSGTYTTIETWTSSKTGTTIEMSETRLINILSTYRLKVTFTAGSETLVCYAYP